jgi:hypothetical protein
MDFVGLVHDGRLQVISHHQYRQNMLIAAKPGKATQASQEAAQAGPGNLMGSGSFSSAILCR